MVGIDQQQLARLRQEYEALLRSVQIREDIRDIEEVTYRYCRAVDRKDGPPADNVSAIHECFTKDCVWDGGVLGRFQGWKGLADFFCGEFQNRMLQMGFHLAINPIIKVNDGEATGDFHQLAQLTFGGEALWAAGRYHNGYIRTATGWKIKVMNYDPWMWSRHLEGWAKERFATTASNLSG